MMDLANLTYIIRLFVNFVIKLLFSIFLSKWIFWLFFFFFFSSFILSFSSTFIGVSLFAFHYMITLRIICISSVGGGFRKICFCFLFSLFLLCLFLFSSILFCLFFYICILFLFCCSFLFFVLLFYYFYCFYIQKI